jgi:hypothetical protein
LEMRLGRLLALGGVLLGAAIAFGYGFPPPPGVDDLVGQSDLIVVAVPTKVPKEAVTGSRQPSELVQVKVVEILRGELAEREIGVIDGFQVPGCYRLPKFQVGESVIMFLGSDRGRYWVRHNSEGVKMATETNVRAYRKAAGSWAKVVGNESTNQVVLARWFAELCSEPALQQPAVGGLRRLRGSLPELTRPNELLGEEVMNTLTNIAFVRDAKVEENLSLLGFLAKEYPRETVRVILDYLQTVPASALNSASGPGFANSIDQAASLLVWIMPDKTAGRILQKSQGNPRVPMSPEDFRSFLEAMEARAKASGYRP